MIIENLIFHCEAIDRAVQRFDKIVIVIYQRHIDLCLVGNAAHAAMLDQEITARPVLPCRQG